MYVEARVAGISNSDEHYQPYFFLSYARTPRISDKDPDPNLWVTKFYRALCQEIMQISRLPAGVSPGFMDQELRVGAAWNERLAKELASCRVFVPLYSPRYFGSEPCGKEWAAFDLRRKRHMGQGPDLPEVMVPAFWVPVRPDELPEMAPPIQFNDPALGTPYQERGVYGLIKLNRYRDHYKSVVNALARRIVDLAENVRLPPGKPCDFTSLKSAFVPDRGRRFQIVVLAPTRDALPPHRSQRQYGAAATDWNPYYPQCDQPIASLAADIVRDLGFEPELWSYADQGEDLLKEDGPASPGVVLLDPWVVLMPGYQAALSYLRRSSHPWVGLVIPWHEDDEQLAAATDQIRAGLHALAPTWIERGRLLAREAAKGTLAFGQFAPALRQVVFTVSRPYLRDTPAFPPRSEPGDAPPRRRDRLTWQPPENPGGT
ncbi:TIR-like protein FxsC [Nonomuraea fuscirosea]|uniref:TIR-like protein FxsC n=1 Tax=Nonomuraea fuscirosea TaxID=1291556 RepID=UPI00349872FE